MVIVSIIISWICTLSNLLTFDLTKPFNFDAEILVFKFSRAIFKNLYVHSWKTICFQNSIQISRSFWLLKGAARAISFDSCIEVNKCDWSWFTFYWQKFRSNLTSRKYRECRQKLVKILIPTMQRLPQNSDHSPW